MGADGYIGNQVGKISQGGVHMGKWEGVEPSIRSRTGGGPPYRVTYWEPGATTSTSRTGFTSLASARAFRDERAADLARYRLRAKGGDDYAKHYEPKSRTPTVGEMSQRYRDSRVDPKPSTVRTYEGTENRIRRATSVGRRNSWLLDKVTIGQLDGDHAAALKNDLEAMGCSGHTIRSALSYLLLVHRYAIDKDIIPPTQQFKAPKVKVPRRKLPMTDPAELGPFAAAVAPRYRVPLLVLVATGLRAGELLGLTAEKIPALRFDGTWRVDESAPPIMTIDQQLDYIPGKGAPRIITDKSEEGELHTVPCPHELTALVAGHLNTYPLGAVVDGQQLLWSTQGQHNLMYYGLLYNQITQAGRAIGKAVTPHDLRRLYASSAFAYGAGLPVVQGLLRHAMAETTLRYGKSFDQQVSEQGLAISRGVLRLVSGETTSRVVQGPGIASCPDGTTQSVVQ